GAGGAEGAGDTRSGLAPAAVRAAAISNVSGVTLEYRNEPVSVCTAVNRLVAMDGVSGASSAVSSRYTISPVAAAPTSIQLVVPYLRLSGWWSMLTTTGAARLAASMSPSVRSGFGQSVSTTTSNTPPRLLRTS